jgi:hypothetical protein
MTGVDRIDRLRRSPVQSEAGHADQTLPQGMG